MWWFFTLFMLHAQARDCSGVSISAVTADQGPSILVLGERRATQPDLFRAHRLVTALGRTREVTLALEAVDHSRQEALSRLGQQIASTQAIEQALAWKEHSPFSVVPYSPLLRGAKRGVHLLAIGVDRSPRPRGQNLPIPPSYFFSLEPSLSEAHMPVALEPSFVEAMAWRDHRLAKHALAGWNGKGTLVVLVDRFHVEGGKGVSWQLQRMTDVPVRVLLLSNAGATCQAGESVLTLL